MLVRILHLRLRVLSVYTLLISSRAYNSSSCLAGRVGGGGEEGMQVGVGGGGGLIHSLATLATPNPELSKPLPPTFLLACSFLLYKVFYFAFILLNFLFVCLKLTYLECDPSAPCCSIAPCSHRVF